MQPLDFNGNLWRDPKALELFIETATLLRQAVSKESMDSLEILKIANMLDDLMQYYETRYCPIEDPMFFWWFATANAFFLQVGKSFDELGPARIGYIINGYKEALNKHLMYPTFTAEMLQVIYQNMEQFANNHDKEWMFKNHSKFKPITE